MGLAEDIKVIKEEIEKNKKDTKEKKYRLPFGKKVGKAQKNKNYVTVIKINENNAVDFTKLPINDQTIMVDTIPRLASAGYVLHWKKNPIIILPSWSLEPFSPQKHFELSMEDGTNKVGIKILLEAMERESTKVKKAVGNFVKIAAGLILGGIIIYAFLTGSG